METENVNRKGAKWRMENGTKRRGAEVAERDAEEEE